MNLLGGASIVILGGLLGNVFNFLFQLFMSRNLSLSDFGALSSLNSLLTLAALPIGALLPTIVYFSASYFAKNELDKIGGLYIKITKPAALIGTLALLFLIIFKSNIAGFLNISDANLILPVALTAFVGFLGVANIPLLQAKLSFGFVTFLTFLSSLFKFIVGGGLILLGFSVGGAMWGYVASACIPYILSFSQLRFLFQKDMRSPHITFASLLSYGTPAMLATLGLTSLVTTDILIIKHFLNPSTAGVYATLSLVGKIIFFFSAPIATVMFPIITQKHTKDENFHNTFKLSLLLVLLPSVGITIIYFLFPEQLLHIFSQKQETIALGSPYLGLFGIFISLYSFLSILVNFYLSIKKTKVFIPMLIGAFAQIILLSFYHSNFTVIILISLVITGLLLALLLLYYFRLFGVSHASKTT